MLVRPGDTWVDVLIGRDDQLWTDDVGHAFHWLGAVWERSFEALGVKSTMHKGPMRNPQAGRIVCFAGLGPGELVDDAGVKLLGLSQRRTRSVARFQCLVPNRSMLSDTIDYLSAGPPEDIDPVTEVGSTLDPDVLTTTFLSELARLP